jgi:hypothetical protein
MDLGMTVRDLRSRMSLWEFLLWGEFYRRERKEIKRMQEKSKGKKR